MRVKTTKLLGLNDKRGLGGLGFLALSSGFLLSLLLSNKRIIRMNRMNRMNRICNNQSYLGLGRRNLLLLFTGERIGILLMVVDIDKGILTIRYWLSFLHD